MPLTIEYQEKIAAVGRIPGNYFRREIGRPSENEVLTCRIDRSAAATVVCRKGIPLKPRLSPRFFPPTRTIQPDMLALTGASCALMLSDIPFDGPVAGGRVGYIDGQYVLNPTIAELKTSAMDIVVACTRDAVVMVEGKADELSEDEVLAGIFYAFEHLQPLIDLQEATAEVFRESQAADCDPARSMKPLRPRSERLPQPAWTRFSIPPINSSAARPMTA